MEPGSLFARVRLKPTGRELAPRECGIAVGKLTVLTVRRGLAARRVFTRIHGDGALQRSCRSAGKPAKFARRA
jgi:hypothetical protein